MAIDREGEADSASARLEAVEIRLTYAERSASDLSAELFEASRRIDRLEKLLREMASKVKELSDEAEPGAPGDVKPPHW